jgi:tRNA threonylcarbamoyladenosine biosynthesis protein TsaE
MSRALDQAPARVEVVTRSAAETRAFAAALAGVARAGDRVALRGPLGAGKTQFAKGFALGLGVQAVIFSPTFTLMAEYEGRLPLFHLDLYRLAGADDAAAAGLLDERQAAGVTLIEWAERLGPEVDPDRLEVELEALDARDGEEGLRRILLSAHEPRYAAYLDRARGWHAA